MSIQGSPMFLPQPLSHLLRGLQLGLLDAMILVFINLLTSSLSTDDSQRSGIRFLTFGMLVSVQVILGLVSVDKGGPFWDPVAEFGYVTMGIMAGAIAIWKLYKEGKKRFVDERKQGGG